MKSKCKLALILLAAYLPLNITYAEQDQADIEDMVVVGSRVPTADYKVGRVVTVLDEQQIQDIGYSSGADLFRFVPGVAVSRTGGYGGLTQLRLRGSEANHVLVLIDGIDVTAAGSGEFDFSSLLSSDIERIEVLRGPQSGLYGSNALAGVISIHTKAPREGFAADINLEAGSDDTQLGGFSISGGNEVLQGRLNFTQRKSEFDLSTDDTLGGEDDEDDNQTISAQLRAVINEALDVSFYGRIADKETDTDGFDFSGGPLQGLAVDNNSFSNTEDQTLGLVANLRLADGRSISRFSIEKTETELDGGTFGSDAERDQIRFDTTWQWTESGSSIHRTTFFIQHEEESFRNPFPFDPSQAPTQERDLLGYGLEHRIELNEQTFINGTVRQDDNDDFEDETTYSIDIAYLLNEGNTRLHASYGRGVTNPTFFEQFGFVPGTFVGNPNLTPEKSTGWDLGVEQQFADGALTMDLTYFDADLEDEIQSVFPSVANAAGESERSGVELSAIYRPGDNTYLTADYTYTDADEPGGEEVRRPKHKASLSAAQSLMDNRLRVTGSIVYNGEQLDNDFRNFFTNGFVAERTELDSYTLVNVSATYSLTDDIEVYVRVENLFDEEYEDVISYAAPGRSVFGGVRFRLGNNE
ncbi:MAG: TonB-dependent receptor [Pseudomonadota bacterium]